MTSYRFFGQFGSSTLLYLILWAGWEATNVLSLSSDLANVRESGGALLPSPSSSFAISRRAFFVGTAAAPFLLLPSRPTQARGLVQFPCEKLANTYHILRVGQTLLDEQDIWSTNPLFLTNREAALSAEGVSQVEEASRRLQQANALPSVIKYSLAAACMDAAAIVSRELRVGQNRVLAEYTFMDPRAIGKWEMLSYKQTYPAVWAMDSGVINDSDQNGNTIADTTRPPPNEDGTPNETLQDQEVRLRQLLSALETQYTGDTILLIFPDGTGPAVLSAMIAGIPFSRLHELEYKPGELRMNVTMESTLALWQSLDLTEYNQILEQGRLEWQRLQDTEEEIVSKKDQRLEAERITFEREQTEREAQRLAREEEIRQARLERQLQIEEQRQVQQQQQKQADDANENLSIDPVSFGLVAAVGGVLGMAQTNPNDSSQASNLSNSSNSFPLDSNVTDLFEPDTSILPTNGDFEVSTVGAGQRLQETRINGDPKGYVQVHEPKDRYEAAEMAMQDYLDQDDGGEAWLQLMVDIAQDRDEADTSVVDDS